MRHLTNQPLTCDRIGQAFTLIQAALPDVALEDWRSFAMPLVQPQGQPMAGILTVMSEQDYIAGLSIYRIEHDLQHGPALVADHFMALDLFDRPAVVHALAAALEDLARERGCTAIHTNIPDRADVSRDKEGGLVSTLRSRGHRVESLRLCKILDRPHNPLSQDDGSIVRRFGIRGGRSNCRRGGIA